MEYQEIVEDEFLAQLDDTSVQSLRSTRRNVATGRSLLVRQKAQVIGRPSMAKADWDIGSVSSSDSGSSRSYRRNNGPDDNLVAAGSLWSEAGYNGHSYQRGGE